MSGFEARISLVFALASQASSVSQRLLMDLASETAKYVLPKRFESRNLEEALMAGFIGLVPDLETVRLRYKQGENGDDYPVITSRTRSDGQRMEMTTPVITKKVTVSVGMVENQDNGQILYHAIKVWFNLPLPKDPSVRIKEVPGKFVTDEEVKQRELRLRDAENDKQLQVKKGASVEVAQYNPPFTLPFARRNEIALELEKKE
ncbi:Soul heme-binding family protein isoform 2 [Hibiscus syriacus]|uniref:Soul heme-binding family protein isoform 2 n=1 Tax=Hibiscus syriacus TaxID=106335 RepID=A0A6A3BQR5_HIBSY|nr:Soul heme-binding family protein isoform 2 [Hibiscus syriacus]